MRRKRARNRRAIARAATVIVIVGLLAPRTARAQARSESTAEVFLGAAWNARTPLTLDGPSGRLRLDADYTTRPFQRPLYWSVRVGHTREGRGGELELIHHKLYLENPRPPIDQLEVTHGYNMLLANGVAPAGGWQLRAGVGLAVAHPDGRIGGQVLRSRNRTLLGGGYHVAGGALQLAVGRRYALTGGRVQLTAAPEIKLTGSWARTELAQGTLRVPNVAVHALAGLGVRRR